MRGIRIQITVPASVAAELDRRGRHMARGRAGLVSALCVAYARFMAARPAPEAADIAGDVREMFAAYTAAEAPSYGAAPVRKHNRHD